MGQAAEETGSRVLKERVAEPSGKKRRLSQEVPPSRRQPTVDVKLLHCGRNHSPKRKRLSATATRQARFAHMHDAPWRRHDRCPHDRRRINRTVVDSPKADNHAGVGSDMIGEPGPDCRQVCCKRLGAAMAHLRLRSVANFVGTPEKPLPQPLIRTIGSQAIVGRRGHDMPDWPNIAKSARPRDATAVPQADARSNRCEGLAKCPLGTSFDGLNDIHDRRPQSALLPELHRIVGFWTIRSRRLIGKI